ncbi:MAG: hypothetical protein HEQ39_01885 [Rhizobacter sp.]
MTHELYECKEDSASQWNGRKKRREIVLLNSFEQPPEKKPTQGRLLFGCSNAAG